MVSRARLHPFFCVGGGNIMHLTESLNRKLICIPVINEVAAGIAAEYFNKTSKNKKALALVTAGPGLTNIITAIAGPFWKVENSWLLVDKSKHKIYHSAKLDRGVFKK